MFNHLIKLLNKPKLQLSTVDEFCLAGYAILLVILVCLASWYGYPIYYKIKWWLKKHRK